MTIDEKIRDEKHNMSLTKKQQKHHHYYRAKLINMKILQAKKYYHLIQLE